VNCMIVRTARIGLAILVGAIMTAAICGDAVARSHKVRVAHRMHHNVHFARKAHWNESRAEAGLFVSPQRVLLGPMRYYGGPKSPMWRGPAEN
jgi:hypothetical protein